MLVKAKILLSASAILSASYDCFDVVFNKANLPSKGQVVSLEQLLGLNIEISDSNPSTVGYSSPSSHASRTLGSCSDDSIWSPNDD